MFKEVLSHPGVEAPEGKRCVCRMQKEPIQETKCLECGKWFKQIFNQSSLFDTCFECYVEGVRGGESLFFRNSGRMRSI